MSILFSAFEYFDRKSRRVGGGHASDAEIVEEAISKRSIGGQDLVGIDAAFSCYLSLGGELALERCKQLDPGSARRAEAIFPLINRRAIEDAGEAAVDKK